MEAEDPLERRAAFKRHADDVRRHVLELGKRDYSGLIQGRVDYTVLFLTGDPLLAAAFEHRPHLLEEALARRVLIATPVTLVALLRTASILWQQKAIDENARLIADGAREFYQRVITFQEHVERIGGSLDRARDAYNKAAASYQSRVLPAGRRLEELGGPAGQKATLSELTSIEGELRQLPATDDGADATPDPEPESEPEPESTQIEAGKES
jgi:DNA recombination protein RmuC